MKLKTKKNIAKEILILLSFVVVLLGLIASLLIWNLIQSRKLTDLLSAKSSLENQFEKLPEGIKSKYRSQESLYNLAKQYSSGIEVRFPNYHNYWDYVVSNEDSAYANMYIVDMILLNLDKRQKFISFIQANTFTYDEEKYKSKLNEIVEKQDALERRTTIFSQKKIDSDNLTSIVAIVGILIFIITYPLRFLIVVIKWSIRIIKQD